MQYRFRTITIIVALAFLATGCQAPKVKPAREPVVGRTIRNNCYSLLHELLDKQKRVSLLRFIKREEGDVKKLVKRIAASSGTGANLLEEFAKQDSSLSLDDTWLPPGEAATREAIAATTKERLLHQSGDEFELTLLLTQIQALSYAAHLAKVAAANDTKPERVDAVTRLGQEMEQFHQEVYGLLLSRTR